MKKDRSATFIEIMEAIFNGEVGDLISILESALKMGLSSEEILEQAVVPATRQVFEQFHGIDFNIPDVLLSSRAIKASLYTLKPQKQPKTSRGKIVIGTVAGDIHDIGKNLISLFLEFSGFEVIDLGVDVTSQVFVQAVREHKPNLLAMSALLTTTMGEMSNVIEMLYTHHIRDLVKIIVGGGPVTREFATSIGADAYAGTPQETVKVINNLLTRRRKLLST